MLRGLLLGMAVALPAPVLAQGADDPEFTYVMVMQFNGCSMTKTEIGAQMQEMGVDPATYEALTETMVARGDAEVMTDADGQTRITMTDAACAPVEMGETEVTTDPQAQEEQRAKFHQDVFAAILGANGCSMTRAEIAAEMPKYGLDLVQEQMVETLVAAGSATLGDEGDDQRVTLGPDVCTDGAAVPVLPVKPESVAKFTDYLAANACAVQIDQLEAVEAELGFDPAESSNVFMVMDIRGDATMDLENGTIRLINKDCP